MASNLHILLPDDLGAFVDQNCGEGARYASPSEFVGELLLQRKMQAEAAAAREGILEGYQDAIAGRTVEFEGDLRSLLEKADR
ncbi:hypothetical protein Pla175_03350 [Pirellulimonas nuda]|uniref:Antitoxin ParD4 n=1 Tax=Pirellulimonas nuda TaxID=2528009 RepID=A0A518D693_9BACT|nr:hypothetical protein [Pirellulimonas nuda]QDU86981.1 hypothetical protein Pla175_03350 [Pirellulimonas nuda]